MNRNGMECIGRRRWLESVEVQLVLVLALLLMLTVLAVLATPEETAALIAPPDWPEMIESGVLPPEPSWEALIGHDVAVDGDTAVLGAYNADVGGTNTGAALVFVRTAGVWSHQATLVPADMPMQQGFGWSVAVSGDTVVVGMPNTPDLRGAAYVFTRSGTTWSQQAKLEPTTIFAGALLFGRDVAIAGDTVVVGAYAENGSTGAAYVFTRSGVTWSQQARLEANDAAASDSFGWSVGVAADTAVIGSPYDDDNGSSSGGVYVFTRSGTTWSQQAKLLSGAAGAGATFGLAVAVAGDTALIGAPSTANATVPGTAYVFTRSGSAWSQQAALTASDNSNGDRFAIKVQLDQDTAVVGRYLDDTNGNNAGAAYVFARSGTTWSQQAKLLASDGSSNDYFGFSVAVSGDTIVSGAVYENELTVMAGTSYVFTRNGTTWSEQVNLIAEWAWAEGDELGYAVAMNDTWALVGAPGADGLAPQTGAVYVYRKLNGEWNYMTRLVAADGAVGDRFGTSVMVDGNTAVIGASFADANGADSGAAYIFTLGSQFWQQMAKLVPADGAAGDRFGESVAISGSTALVGAFNDVQTATGDKTGSAYVFVDGGSGWTEQAKLLANDAEDGAAFGWAVALENDTAVVGARFHGANDEGAVYIFSRSGTAWNQQTKRDGLSSNTLFGADVAIDTGTLAVGASGARQVYVYEVVGNTWTEAARLSGLINATLFGDKVALAGDRLVVGAQYQGTGYVNYYQRSAGLWSAVAELVPSDVGSSARLGSDVAVFGDEVVVGASLWDSVRRGTNAGAAYLFTPVAETVGVAATNTAVAEGSSSDNDTDITFTITRTGTLTDAVWVNYSVIGSGGNPVDAADFGGQLPSGSFEFADGEASRVITVTLSADYVTEADESLALMLNAVTGAVAVNTVTAPVVVANDDVASVAVAGAANLAVSEAGVTATYTLTLTSEPTSVVTVTLTPDGRLDVGNGGGGSMMLSFDASNWDVGQAVVVTAVDNEVVDVSDTAVISYSVSSSDGFYDGMNLSPETVAIVDNDFFELFLPVVLR